MDEMVTKVRICVTKLEPRFPRELERLLTLDPSISTILSSVAVAFDLRFTFVFWLVWGETTVWVLDEACQAKPVELEAAIFHPQWPYYHVSG